MTTNEERLAALEAALDASPSLQINSAEELARHEQVRFAEEFGFSSPRFRSVVRMRFYGDGVQGHDLRGRAGGDIIARITEAVKAAGSKVKTNSPSDLELFLSPTVLGGSTVIELYGGIPSTAPDDPPTMDASILDSPLDLAIGNLFKVIDGINPESLADTEIDGALGRHLFSLTKDLIDSDLDLDLTWQRPRGSIRKTELPRAKSRHLRHLLDRQWQEDIRRDEVGELSYVATDGTIGLVVGGRKRAIQIMAGQDVNLSALLPWWSRQVRVVWLDSTVSHPQRESKTTTHHLISIELAQAAEPPDETEISIAEDRGPWDV